MKPEAFCKKIYSELYKKRSASGRKSAQKFFKHPIKTLGVSTPQVRLIATHFYREIQELPKKDIFAICELLLKNTTQEEATVGLSFARRLVKRFEKSDFNVFEKWIEKGYIDDWAKCDDLCTHVMNYFVYTYPEYAQKMLQWSKSKNMWLRRASAVSFIRNVKVGRRTNYGSDHDLKILFTIAKNLMKCPEDLVQKGYGWMLKATSVVYPQEVFDFVLKHEKQMTRTAFRYAIEKLPPSMRRKAMKNN